MKKFLSIFSCLLFLGCAGTGHVMEAKVASAPSPSMSLERAKASSSPARSERMVAYKASIDLRVGDSEDAKKEIVTRTTELGGYVAEESKDRMVVFVPAKDLDDFILWLDGPVGKITDKNKMGEDVTDDHSDTSAELAAAKAARDSYTNLLKRAAKVEDVLKIETELERVNAKILRLERQLERTEKSVALSRVSIKLTDKSLLGKIFSFWFNVFF